MSASVAVRLRAISKRFGAVQANREVSFDIAAGSVHGLVGENGAGKSTLMKIVAGVQDQDSGTVEVDGRPERIGTVQRAAALGITLIHQELILCDNLTVGAWMHLGREPRRGPFIDFRTIEAESRRHLERLGVCLLYTSPSPRDQRGSRMPSSA